MIVPPIYAIPVTTKAKPQTPTSIISEIRETRKPVHPSLRILEVSQPGRRDTSFQFLLSWVISLRIETVNRLADPTQRENDLEAVSHGLSKGTQLR